MSKLFDVARGDGRKDLREADLHTLVERLAVGLDLLTEETDLRLGGEVGIRFRMQSDDGRPWRLWISASSSSRTAAAVSKRKVIAVSYMWPQARGLPKRVRTSPDPPTTAGSIACPDGHGEDCRRRIQRAQPVPEPDAVPRCRVMLRSFRPSCVASPAELDSCTGARPNISPKIVLRYAPA